MRILAIPRKGYFSPNHIGNDAAIFNLVCSELVFMGAHIELCNEDDFLSREHVEQDYIINMGRSKALLEKLKMLEDAGTTVVNSAYGVERCFRKNMTLALLEQGIPYPNSFVVDTHSDLRSVVEKLGSDGVWLKRGDFHAIHKEDVSFAANTEQAQSIVSEYALRHIQEAVVSEHLKGDLLKFYGVRGTPFFYSFYPYEHNHHKYSVYEQINGTTLHYPFNLDDLKKTAEHAASILDVHIYGGDAIIGSDGRFHIIDLNDWPSFAPCREEASQAISSFLFHYFKSADARRESSTTKQ